MSAAVDLEQASNDRRATIGRSLRDAAPILAGVLPFGLVTGLASTEAGLSLLETVGLSVLVFAGASQLAAVDLIGRDAAPLVVIGTILVINLRMMMYSASLSPYFAFLPRRTRLLAAYPLTDQAYVLSVGEYERRPASAHRLAYYLTSAIALWVCWQIEVVAGAVGGDLLPDDVPLDFAVPLAFITLLIPSLTDRPRVLAAAVSGAVAVGLSFLPANLGLLVGATVGIGAGAAAEVRTTRRAESTATGDQ